MKYLRITSYAVAALGFAHSAGAAPAGTVLFTQPGTQIVGTNGTARAATKGDMLQTGERLLTPPGAISQVLLPDGSLIGMRPESELKLEAAPGGSDGRAPVVNLVNGTARIIGAELMDNKKGSNFTLQSGQAMIKLKGADLESAVVKADGKSAVGDTSPGSYQRLLVGSGTVASGSQVAALTPRQVSFTGSANAAPVTLAAPSQNVFGGGNRGGGGGANATTPYKLPNTLTPPRPVMPLVQPVAVPVTVPPVRPCTRFIGKTCIQ